MIRCRGRAAAIRGAQNIKGWGYTRYTLAKLGPMAGTLIGVDRKAPKVPRFVTLVWNLIWSGTTVVCP